MLMKNHTIFEKIITREIDADILFEDDFSIIIKDISPQAPTHVLIIPKKKIARVGEIIDEDLPLLGHLMLVIKNFAEANKLSSYRLIINNGLQAGETVPHLHIHLLAGRPMTWPPG